MEQKASLVVFQVEEQLFGVPIEIVTEIIPLVTVSRVPNMPVDWLGIANVRGAVTPVIDYRVRIGLSKEMPSLAAPLVIIRQGRQQVALLVEQIKQILTVADTQMGGDAPALIYEGQLLMLVDPTTLMASVRSTKLS